MTWQPAGTVYYRWFHKFSEISDVTISVDSSHRIRCFIYIQNVTFKAGLDTLLRRMGRSPDIFRPGATRMEAMWWERDSWVWLGGPANPTHSGTSFALIRIPPDTIVRDSVAFMKC